MMMLNEIGRRVMQGGSRRSAIYASLNWQHQDANEFLIVKD
jgi:ribonucleoside-diphosphate reductase alpha chain